MERESIDIHSRLYDYSVYFVDDFSDVIGNMEGQAAFVIDRNVYSLYREKFSRISEDRIFFVDAVENKKNMDTAMEMIRFWSSIRVKKNWKILCFGGGITQDVTTIAADLFLRNIDWYFFPTTLLSMSDSCIGGKCGINLGEYKNQIGVFYPPKKIYLDMRFLETLTEGDYLNGWGEILKFSLTSAPGFYEEIKKEKRYIPCGNISEYIRKGLEVKKEIIEADEFESDLRRVLNYGHTFGHALEAYTHNEIPHGKGVIWGMDVANYLACKEGMIDREYYLDIKQTIKDSFLKDEVEIKDPHKLYEIIKTDKKVKDDVLYFALLDGNSHLCVHPLKLDNALENTFLEYLEETHEYYND